MNLRCELCNTPMTSKSSPDSPMSYFHCARCGRWVASNYRAELVRAGTARIDRQHQSSANDPHQDLEQIKERLVNWLKAIDERDPYYVLGVSPSANEETIKARFKELAFANHPDRGGDPAKMQQVVTAFDRIRRAKPRSKKF